MGLNDSDCLLFFSRSLCAVETLSLVGAFVGCLALVPEGMFSTMQVPQQPQG